MSKPADLMRLRESKAERAARNGAAFMVAVNSVFNGMIDQLRKEREKNRRLVAAVRKLISLRGS